MNLKSDRIEFYIPDNTDIENAIKRTTHMGIGAHPDDLEIIASHGILQCLGSEQNWFFGVVATDGAGFPKRGLYEGYTREQINELRKSEQKKAAFIGEYGGVAFLNYKDFPDGNSDIDEWDNPGIVDELKELISTARPRIIYTHNLMDKHETHVNVAIKTIYALRQLPEAFWPEKLLGCEVWRDLDWLGDRDKVALDVSAHQNLMAAVLEVYDSQIQGGKRYDLASIGRRTANATYSSLNEVDGCTALTYAMDLTPLLKHEDVDICEYINQYIQRFSCDILGRVKRYL